MDKTKAIKPPLKTKAEDFQEVAWDLEGLQFKIDDEISLCSEKYPRELIDAVSAAHDALGLAARTADFFRKQQQGFEDEHFYCSECEQFFPEGAYRSWKFEDGYEIKFCEGCHEDWERDSWDRNADAEAEARGAL